MRVNTAWAGRSVPNQASAGGAVAISSLRRAPECHPSMPRLADRNRAIVNSEMRLLDIDPKWPVIRLTLPIAHANCFPQPLCSRVFNKGDVIESQSMLALTSPIGLPTAYAE